MAAAMVLFALNGLYQHRSWWVKGGKETVFADVDATLPSEIGHHPHFGGSFQVCG